MRARIAEAKSPDGPLDAKLGAGRMQDVELMAQAGCLMAGRPGRDVAAGLAAGVEIGWLDDADRLALERAYVLCWHLVQSARLLSGRPLDQVKLGEAGTAFVLRETGYDSMAALQAALEQVSGKAAGVIGAALDRRPGEGRDGT